MGRSERRRVSRLVGVHERSRSWFVFFFKQKTAYEILAWLEFRRVLFRSRSSIKRFTLFCIRNTCPKLSVIRAFSISERFTMASSIQIRTHLVFIFTGSESFWNNCSRFSYRIAVFNLETPDEDRAKCASRKS